MAERAELLELSIRAGDDVLVQWLDRFGSQSGLRETERNQGADHGAEVDPPHCATVPERSRADDPTKG
jgi:hypothetical protein